MRRAQLEKEPTPPPEDPKAKRKRPKKKKDPANQGGSPAKKRYKKAANLKVDDGHEVFMENLMQQLRALPPIRVLEPRIKPNFNVCSAPGAGDLNAKESCLRGTYGHAHPSSQVDFYASQPFGSNPPTPPSSLPPTPPPVRGYYNQEFPSKSKGIIAILKNCKNENTVLTLWHHFIKINIAVELTFQYLYQLHLLIWTE